VWHAAIHVRAQVKVVREMIYRRLVLNEAAHAKYLIYGADSDLVLLALLSQVGDVYLLDERASTRLFSTRLFDQCIAEALPARASLSAARFDFALLALLRGNDYLPKLRHVKLGLAWTRYCQLRTRRDSPYAHEQVCVGWSKRASERERGEREERERERERERESVCVCVC
jgi:hypothetical protein